MPWTVSDIPDQTGRVALITGANSGLGLEMSKILLSKGATVLMGCRSPSKAQIVQEDFLGSSNSSNLDIVPLDLSDLISISKAVHFLKREYGRLDLLINNAGIMAFPRMLSKQGFELQFAVNHLGHMALTLLLIPLLEKQPQGRVVTVTSGAQFIGKILWDDLQGEFNYSRWGSYAQSKLANTMFAIELQNRLKLSGKKLISLSAHPGLVRTNLQKTSSSKNNLIYERLLYFLLTPFFQSCSMGVLPQLFAATSRSVQGGEQYSPRLNFRGYPILSKIPAIAKDFNNRERLWRISEQLLLGTGVITKADFL